MFDPLHVPQVSDQRQFSLVPNFGAMNGQVDIAGMILRSFNSHGLGSAPPGERAASVAARSSNMSRSPRDDDRLMLETPPPRADSQPEVPEVTRKGSGKGRGRGRGRESAKAKPDRPSHVRLGGFGSGVVRFFDSF